MPDALAAALEDGATMVFGVPTMYHRLAEEAAGNARARRAPLARPRLLVSGSAPLPAARLRARARADRAADRRALRPDRDADEHRRARERRAAPRLRRASRSRASSCGWSPTTEATSRSPDDETIGEIAVRGPNLFTGYLNNPDATAAAMRDGWFFTGDIGTRTPDGYLRIVGRRSTDLIKTGGYKVGAGEVEMALLGHPAVDEAAVVGAADPTWVSGSSLSSCPATAATGPPPAS